MRKFIMAAACLMALSALVGGPRVASAKPRYCHGWASSLNAKAKSFNARCAHKDLSDAVYRRCKSERDRVYAEQQRYHRACGR